MKKDQRKNKGHTALRKRAETLLNKQPVRIEDLSARDARSLIHELGTHQIELEIQNEELRRAQEELENAGRKYAELYNFAPVGYITLNKTGIIAEANLTAARLLGARKGLLIGKPFNSFLASEADGRVFFSHRAKALMRGVKAVCEVRMRRKDKALFYAQLETVAVDEGEGAGGTFRTVIIDITERKKAEEAFRRYARRLVEKDEDIRRKLAGELHDELGRSLTLLGINFAVLTEDMPAELQEKQGERIRGVQGLIEDASRNVRNIMTELRPPVLDDYGLAAALRWHCDLFSKRTGIAVTVRTDESFPRLVPEKESAFYRITQEALVNVAKHAKATRVTVSLGSAGDWIRLSVADNGRGFELHDVPARQAETGWGLTIMRERALSSGGTFRVDSAPRKGTRITVEIPRSGRV